MQSLQIDSSVVIGLDFGSTSSVVSYYKKGNIQTIEPTINLEDGKPTKTIPSLVYINEKEKEVEVGQNAISYLYSDPTNCVTDLKSRVSTMHSNNDPIEVRKTYIYLAELFRNLKTEVELKLSCKVFHCVLTVPAYFSETTRHILKDAARICGLNVLRILNQPTAATVYYCYTNPIQNTTALFVDIGGKTTDMTLCNIMEGVTDVIATAGDPTGGMHIVDEQITRALMLQIKKQNDELFHRSKVDPLFKRVVKTLCENIKLQFCNYTPNEIKRTAVFQDADKTHYINIQFSKKQLQSFFELFLQKFTRLYTQLMKKCIYHYKESDIDVLIILGGPSCSPFIKETVSKVINVPQNPYFCGITSVSKGAALYGALILGYQSKLNVLSDIVSLPIGLKVQGHAFEEIIPSNTKLPCKKTITYTTTEDFQSKVLISVYEGPRIDVSKNNFLGEVLLEDIQIKPRGTPLIDVTLELTEQNVLHVYVEDKNTLAKKSLKIASNSRLDQKQIDKLKEAPKKYTKRDTFHVSIMKIRQEIERKMQQVKSLCAITILPLKESKLVSDLLSQYNYVTRCKYRSMTDLILLRKQLYYVYAAVRDAHGPDIPTDIVQKDFKLPDPF